MWNVCKTADNKKKNCLAFCIPNQYQSVRMSEVLISKRKVAYLRVSRMSRISEVRMAAKNILLRQQIILASRAEVKNV